MTIRTRLTIYFCFVTFLVLLIISLFIYFSIKDYNNRVFYNRLQAKALTTASRLLKIERLDPALLKIIDNAEYDLLDYENITVYDSTNTQIYTNNDTINYQTSPQLFQRIHEEKQIRYTEGPYKVIAFEYDYKSNRIFVTAGAEDRGGEELLRHIRTILVVTMLVSLIVLYLIGWLFVGEALYPISDIIYKVENLSPVEHSERLPLRAGHDEIAELIRTFNALFDRLEDSFSLQKNFSANVSHELNNPLAKIKSQIEVSLLQNRSNESYHETLRSVLEDVNELIVLVTDLMKFSKLSSDPTIPREQLRIDELLFDIRDSSLQHFPNYKIAIDLKFLPPTQTGLLISGNRQLLSTAIKNIIENGCKFSPDKTVSVSLEQQQQNLIVKVIDNGPGIRSEDLPQIFDLFYRSSSMESVKGYGIGLALAQRILKAHGFAITATSQLGKGTTFIITIPN